MDEIGDLLKKLDSQIKRGLVDDEVLNSFLTPFFNSKLNRKQFIKNCLKKLKTRRMLLRAQWYSEISDGLYVVKNNRPALQVIFLMSLAEGVARIRTNNDGNENISSWKMIKEFFYCIPLEDKKLLIQNFQRAFIKIRHHNLRFTSIIRILYDIRNKAVHGYDFYSFSLLSEEQRKEFVNGGYTSYGLMISGFLGKRGRKQRITLITTLTYEELKNIVIRTAIENINKELKLIH